MAESDLETTIPTRGPRRNFPFTDQAVPADFNIIKIRLFQSTDLVCTGCNINSELSFRNGDYPAAVLIHANTETRTNILNQRFANFYSDFFHGVFADIELDISLE